MSTKFAVVILAAGQGTRMKSTLPKVLHEVVGRPLLEHVLKAVAPLKPERTVVVVGYGAEQVKQRLAHYPIEFVLQEERLGTGHALRQSELVLRDFDGPVLVLNGDGPLLKTATLAAFIAKQQSSAAGMSLLTCEVADPSGLGRIVRKEDGSVAQIVEEKDADSTQKSIREVNPGIYMFDQQVFELAAQLSNDNAAKEYYITDLPGIYLSLDKSVQALRIADETEVLGINDRKQLAYADRILRDRVREQWLLVGVTMTSPEQTFIDDTVHLGPDVVLEQGVTLTGRTVVEAGARVGAYAHLTDCTVTKGAYVAPHTVKRGETLG